MASSPVPRYTFRALTDQPGVLGRLSAWSLVEALPTLLTGYATARAVDDGFLADRPEVGLTWLAAVAVAVAVGALAAGRTYRCLAALAEPFRDGLTRLVVTASLHRAVTGDGRADPTTVSRLTHQVEIVRDTFAGLIMVVRGFVVSATAALIGLLSLDAVAAGLVAAPLVAGLVLFVAVLPAMVARQRDYVLADEQVAAGTTEVISGRPAKSAGGSTSRPSRSAGWPGWRRPAAWSSPSVARCRWWCCSSPRRGWCHRGGSPPVPCSVPWCTSAPGSSRRCTPWSRGWPGVGCATW